MPRRMILSAFSAGWVGFSLSIGSAGGGGQPKGWCFFREVLLTFSKNLATHDSSWISCSFSGNKHV